MSRADYASCRSAQVLLKILEAAGHPKAPLLFAIGAERPKPQGAASEACALGLTVQEEKLAKWVAILKRDAEKLFGKPFLEALRDILKEGENDMEIHRGAGFFEAKSQPLFKKLAEDLLRAKLIFRSGEATLSTIGTNCHVLFTDLWGGLCELRVYATDAGGNKHYFYIDALRARSFQFSDDGFPDLCLRVRDRRAMNSTKNFARVWEAKSKQLKDSREAKVTIYQDFA